MSNSVLFGEESQKKLLKGLDLVADAVGGTLGPNGRNAFIEKPYQSIITNDGATIANSIVLQDKFEDLGAGIIRNASAKTNDDCGDGTTTTAVLLQAIIHESLKRPENPMIIRESLNEATKYVVNLIKERSRDATKEDLSAVAKISAENNEIASMITDLLEKLGSNAVINIEDSKTAQSMGEIVPGYDAPVGFVSPYFINEPKTGRANFKDVHVLVSEKKLSSLVDLKPIADIFKQENVGECIFVCEDIDESIIGVLIQNNIKGVFKSVVIRTRGEILEDIAGAVGANIISDRHGINFQNVKLSDLGRVESASIGANKSVFLGNSVSGAIRAAELDGLAESEENQYRKQKLRDRAAKLRGGIGVLRIGANTDYERDYLKLKAEDAIKAVQAAQEEGVVAGGGTLLHQISKEMNGTVGREILAKALKVPLRRIVENGAKDYTEVMVMGKLYSEEVIENSGIVDPAKVERCALENAVSAAGSFITSFVSITENPENGRKTT